MGQASERRRTRSGRGGGRVARHAARAPEAVQVNPCPPGQAGGRYRPLLEAEIQAIYRMALRLLAELGMGEVPPDLQEIALAKGARLNGEGRLCYPAALVEDIVAAAAKGFVFHGRDPSHDIELGGERVYYGTGGAAVQTLDLDSGLYRPSTLRDLYDFTRLIDSLTNVSWFTRCCIATDLPDLFELDVNTAYCLLRGTTKPVGTAFTLAAHVDPIVDMFDSALGGSGRYRRRPFCKAHISPVISPLRYGEDAVAVAMACIDRGVPISCITAAMSGATAPATLAGFLAQSLAETLASLAMVNLVQPGYPMIFSNWPLVIDLRTGAFSGGGGESALMNAASAQLINWLGLPSGVASSMSDAKAVDAQMGMEKALSALAAGLAGANLVYESSGMMASLLGASFEAFVLDNEMLGHVYRVLRGVEVNEETLSFAAIREAVLGEGHFLGGAQTRASMQRDYFYPTLADRDEPTTWAEKGAKEAWGVARERARQILAQPRPDYLSAAADAAIRQRLPIRLD
ncbi:MAG: trimethylamine methyltransferase family protein [Rhodospirillales bacterium]